MFSFGIYIYFFGLLGPAGETKTTTGREKERRARKYQYAGEFTFMFGLNNVLLKIQ